MSETFTEKLKLSKRDTGDLNWGEGANANLDLLDTHAQQESLRPPRTLLASLGSGGVGGELSGNTTYFYKITAINDAGETKETQIPSVVEAQVTEPATPVPVILQWETVKGASGYRIYKSTVTGDEKYLAEVAGESTSQYTDDGNTAVNAGISVPVSNNAHTAVKQIIAGTNISLDPSHGKGEVTINAAGGGVSSLRKTGEASGLTGDVELEAGANITLTQDGPNNKITIEAAGGGGGGGYVTALVDAPTGVAATDTSNIQSALSAAASAGGGTVLLREGTYNINATLSIGSKVVLRGQGREATTILCDATMGSVSTISTSGSDNGLRDLTIDENQPNRSGSVWTGSLMNSTRPYIFDCSFKRNFSSGVFVFLGSGGQMRNCVITNDGNALSTGIVQGGELIDSCYLTQAQSGNVNDFMQQPTQVINCRLIRSQGTVSGAGIRASTSNKIIIGNGIFLGSGNNAIIIGGSAGTYMGNICQGGNIQLDSGAGSNVVVGNASANIVDNSGQSNQIANNS
jgi:hypothetical protein